jgi:hypothetical protein
MAAVVEQVSNLRVLSIRRKMFTGMFKTPCACFCAQHPSADASAPRPVIYGDIPIHRAIPGQIGRLGVLDSRRDAT